MNFENGYLEGEALKYRYSDKKTIKEIYNKGLRVEIIEKWSLFLKNENF